MGYMYPTIQPRQSASDSTGGLGLDPLVVGSVAVTAGVTVALTGPVARRAVVGVDVHLNLGCHRAAASESRMRSASSLYSPSMGPKSAPIR